MANETKIAWGSLNAFTITNLHSLGAGSIWQSGEINNASPSDQLLEVWYHLVFNATPIAGDVVRFWIAKGNGDGTEIWDGDIGVSEGAITTAANIAAVRQSLRQVHSHAWTTSHGVTFKGHFVVPAEIFAPDWQLLIMPDGEALTTGNVVKYRYGSPQFQP